ncbi:ion channel protein [Tessaracoccus palaemonis]|uniref:Ion channel protein n=1 Tax=Tessaracoccus palaemonis TaxID=2829499 RepID=A0ABX8SEB1_9ACTN|nr:ion channel protein [Tessaracoccus palaemonis]QXT61646.1 ion channel protein [Tessaracoccus palaemonis]
MDTMKGPSPAQLAAAAVPAMVVGLVCAVLLVLADLLAEVLHHGWWEALPSLLGIDPASRWWIVLVLTATGALVGLVLWKAPGHGGHDTATVEMVSPPLPLSSLPGVAAVLVLGLAGGVSLGPEGPIIMVATGLVVAAYRRLLPQVPIPMVIAITAAGMLGAMLGTPIAAALACTGAMGGKAAGSLWDRMFTPLVAAGTGAVGYYLLGGQAWGGAFPAYAPQWMDLLTGTAVAALGAILSLVAAAAFAPVHALFRRLRHPLVYVTLGGLLLGILGAIGGPITLFKGAEQTAELIADRDAYGALALLAIVVIKLIAIVIAGASGFRGGRVFPALFTGVAVGLLGHTLVPSMPVTLAVAAGVLGVLLAVSRDGWFAIFGGALIVGDAHVLPVLCIIVLPAWLILTAGPEMMVHEPAPAQPQAPAAG